MAGETHRPEYEHTRRLFGSAGAIQYFARRTAEREGAFFLPYLRPGMRVLDVGCGPGTITVGLAAAVAPGEVVGVDGASSSLEGARGLAAERGVLNACFEQADLHALPFPDAAFDEFTDRRRSSDGVRRLPLPQQSGQAGRS
jgi:ubiquinone/menaquinone biosynthesis C-methylase UbiE